MPALTPFSSDPANMSLGVPRQNLSARKTRVLLTPGGVVPAAQSGVSGPASRLSQPAVPMPAQSMLTPLPGGPVRRWGADGAAGIRCAETPDTGHVTRSRISAATATPVPNLPSRPDPSPAAPSDAQASAPDPAPRLAGSAPQPPLAAVRSVPDSSPHAPSAAGAVAGGGVGTLPNASAKHLAHPDAAAAVQLTEMRERQAKLEAALAAAEQRAQTLATENARLILEQQQQLPRSISRSSSAAATPREIRRRESSFGEMDERLTAASHTLWDGARRVAELSLERRELIDRCARAEAAARSARDSCERLASKLAIALAPEGGGREARRASASPEPLGQPCVESTPLPAGLASARAPATGGVLGSNGCYGGETRSTMLLLGRRRFEQMRSARKTPPHDS